MKRTILLFMVAAILFVRSSGHSIVNTSYLKDSSRLIVDSDSSSSVAQYAVDIVPATNEGTKISRKQKRKNEKALARRVYITSKKINPDFLAGIDIVAFGADPSWSLDINHNKAIQFSVPGLESPIAFSPMSPVLSNDSLIYNIVTAHDKMQIILAPGDCNDGVGDNFYDYKVTIHYKNKAYNGCGAVMNADGSLTGIWLLNNIVDESNKWEKQPYLIVDLAAERFYGNTGCNNFSGSARMSGPRLCFSDIKFESQKECMGYDENKLIDALIKCNGFTIANGKLQMMQDGRTVMYFNRQLEDYL